MNSNSSHPNKHKLSAFLMAAGEGRRLRPLSENTAKPAIPFLNVPKLTFAYSLANKLGAENICINAFHQPDTLLAAANRVSAKIGGKLQFSKETKLMGHAGIPLAKDLMGSYDDLLITNADTIFLLDNFSVAKVFLATHNENDITLWVTPHQKPASACLLFG